MTEKELQIIRLIADGRTNNEIAKLLGLSYGSIRCRIQEIYIKTGLKVSGAHVGSHRVSLTRWAFRQGVIAALAILFCVGTASAAVTIVHSHGCPNQSTGSPCTMGFSVSAGNSFVVGIGLNANTTVTSVTTSPSVGTMAAFGSAHCTDSVGGNACDWWLVCNASAAASLTVTVNSTAGTTDFEAYELGGTNTSSCKGNVALINNHAAGASPAGPSVTPAASGDIALSIIVGNTLPSAVANGFTGDILSAQTPAVSGIAHDITSSGAAVNPTWTRNSDTYGASSIIIVAPGAGGGCATSATFTLLGVSQKCG